MKVRTSIELRGLSFPADGDAGQRASRPAPSPALTASFVGMALLMMIGAVVLG